MACEFCSTSINVFTRKRCVECQRLHCSKCSARLAMQKVCIRCYRLISLTFTRPELDQYTVKELRHFLIRNKHRTDNYTEKTDLVEAVMKFSQAHGRSAEDREHIRHVERLKERMMKENLNSRRPPSSSSSSTTTTSGPSSSSHPSSERSTTFTPQQTSSSSIQVEIIIPSAPPPAYDVLSSSSSSTGAFTTTTTPVDPSSAGAMSTDDTTAPSVLPDPTDASPVASSQTDTTEPTMCGTPNRRMTLKQLSRVEDIERLSVRQLKELLVTNYVDYKGCCERQELMDRVQRLWLDDRKNRGLATDENIASDVDLCKVCMDAVIDCILLECGHMVTCTQCGRRMAECPICRHYVSRVVHVFKA